MSAGLSLTPGSRPGAAAMTAAAARGRSLWDDARRRLLRNKAATAAMAVLALLVLLALLGPFLTPFAYDEINKDDVWAPPLTAGHLLGADSLGRDLLARLLVGLRVSLAIGVAPQATPITRETKVAVTPIASDTRRPISSRASRSRPSESVPIRCAPVSGGTQTSSLLIWS